MDRIRQALEVIRKPLEFAHRDPRNVETVKNLESLIQTQIQTVLAQFRFRLSFQMLLQDLAFLFKDFDRFDQAVKADIIEDGRRILDKMDQYVERGENVFLEESEIAKEIKEAPPKPVAAPQPQAQPQPQPQPTDQQPVGPRPPARPREFRRPRPGGPGRYERKPAPQGDRPTAAPSRPALQAARPSQAPRSAPAKPRDVTGDREALKFRGPLPGPIAPASPRRSPGPATDRPAGPDVKKKARNPRFRRPPRSS